MSLNEISIEIIQQCPNNCLHCSSNSCWGATHVMPYDLVRETIHSAVELGAKTICLSGGEPFLHPNIVDIAKDVYELGAQCVIYSSGIYFADGKYQQIPIEILAQIKKYAGKIIINYEASKGKIYDLIMGTSFGGYRIMRRTIKAILKLDIDVETHVVPMKLNYKQIPQIIRQCSELGIRRISFLRLVEQGRAQENVKLLALSQAELDQLKKQIQKYVFQNEIPIRVGIPLRECATKINCMTGISKLNIRYDGLVYPCEAFKNDLPVGFTEAGPDSIYDKPLECIYQDSPYLLEIRDRLQAFQLVKTCENCMNQYYRKESLK